MTLKEALISECFYREPKDQNIIYINLTRISNIENLLKEVYKTGIGETIHMVNIAQGNKLNDSFAEEWWEENKSKFIG